MRFVEGLEVVVPRVSKCPVQAETSLDPWKALGEEVKYFQGQFPLSFLLEKGPYTRLLLHANLKALGTDGTESEGNVVGIDEGKVYLRVSKDLYERLGLVGKPLDHRRLHGLSGPRGPSQWLVTLDMRQPGWMPGGGHYPRLKRAFQEIWTDTLDWTWTMDEGKGCSAYGNQGSRGRIGLCPFPYLIPLITTLMKYRWHG